MNRVPKKDNLENMVINKVMREQRKAHSRVLQTELKKKAGDYWISSRSQSI